MSHADRRYTYLRVLYRTASSSQTANYKHNSRDVCLGHEFKDMYGLKLNAKSNLDNISDLPRLTLSMSHDVDLMN